MELSWQKACIFLESPLGCYYYHKINIEKSMCKISEIIFLFKSKLCNYNFYNYFLNLKSNYIILYKFIDFINYQHFIKFFFISYLLNNYFFNFFIMFVNYNFKKYLYKYFYFFKNSFQIFLSDRIDPLFCVNLRIFYCFITWKRCVEIHFFDKIIYFFIFGDFNNLWFYNFKKKKKVNINKKIYNNFFFIGGYSILNLQDLLYSFCESKSKKSLICDRLRMPFFLNILQYGSFFSAFIYPYTLNCLDYKKFESLNDPAYALKFIKRFGFDKNELENLLAIGEDYSSKKLQNNKISDNDVQNQEYDNFTGRRVLFLEQNILGLNGSTSFENEITLNLNYFFLKNSVVNTRKIIYLENNISKINPLFDVKNFFKNTKEIYYLSNPAARLSINKDKHFLELLDNVTDTELPDEYKGDILEGKDVDKYIRSITEDFK